jgi:hypothetical protein
MKYVLDVNVALKWVLTEADSPMARRLRRDGCERITADTRMVTTRNFPANRSPPSGVWEGVCDTATDGTDNPVRNGPRGAARCARHPVKVEIRGSNPLGGADLRRMRFDGTSRHDTQTGKAAKLKPW